MVFFPFSVPYCSNLNQYNSITLFSNRLWVSNDTIKLLQIVQMVGRGALLYFSTTNWLLGYITDCMPLSFKQYEKLNKPLNYPIVITHFKSYLQLFYFWGGGVTKMSHTLTKGCLN